MLRTAPTLALLCALACACGGPLAAGGPDGASLPAGGDDGGPGSDGGAGPADGGPAPVDGGPADAGDAGPASGDGGPASDAGAPGDGGPASDAGSDAGPPLTGQLVGGPGPAPGPLEGLRFRSGAQAGYTDANGSFTYEAGQEVVFAVADVTFRPVPGKPWVSPYDLVTGGLCTPSDELTRLLVFLAGLDDDADASTGLRLAHFPAATPEKAFASLTASGVEAKISALMPGRGAPPAQPLLDAFALQLGSEEWAQVAVDTFTGLDAARRSQGVTTDGSRWFFSWKLGLDRTALDYSSESRNDLAIPAQLATLYRSDHIGDVDLSGGKLYAPIEDGGDGYKAPYLVVFDPESLKAGDTHALDPSLLTQGVPWVAVDGPRKLIYVAEWNPTTKLEQYALDFTHAGSLPLSRTLGRIQGAKVFEGSLYAAADDADKTVYKIDLDSGTVLSLFAMKHGQEQEGLVLLDHAGALMHTLNVAGTTSMEFRHHARTREPLRRKVCP